MALRHGKTLKATCRGKAGGLDVAHDLAEGEGEGTVHATLDIGGTVDCSGFAGNPADGSKGRRFLGKDSPAPETWPG